MTACLLYAKIHKNKAENLLHLMLYFSQKNRANISVCIFCAAVLYYSILMNVSALVRS